MKMNAFVKFAAAALISLAGSVGCVPSAQIDVRNLSGETLRGSMAMLPPMLSPRVEDKTMAASFVGEMVGRLREAGIDVSSDDLGGRLGVRVAQSQPSVATAGMPRWLDMSDADRVEMLRGTSYSLVCQPILPNYGFYSVYVPPEVITTGYPDYGYPHWRRDYYYDTTYIPGHFEPGAVIRVVFHVFDAKTGREVYYVAATSSAVDYRPAELEKGFYKPLVKAFCKAFGVKPEHK